MTPVRKPGKLKDFAQVGHVVALSLRVVLLEKRIEALEAKRSMWQRMRDMSYQRMAMFRRKEREQPEPADA